MGTIWSWSGVGERWLLRQSNHTWRGASVGLSAAVLLRQSNHTHSAAAVLGILRLQGCAVAIAAILISVSAGIKRCDFFAAMRRPGVPRAHLKRAKMQPGVKNAASVL